ncbi:MAG: hypothetical protein HOA17_03595 [Candidatus Melainabacteria bacterium]|jgi:hypothetical protein|nr:hypothetical protein [Candidatus Melainabacteria bacterium]
MARGQIEDRIYKNRVEDLAKAIGIDTKLSLLTGLEIQSTVEGDNLETQAVAKPESLTKEVYEQIVKTALLHEMLGQELTDWSAGNFINNDGQIKLVDLGGTQTITDQSASAERLAQISNIGESFHCAGDDTSKKAKLKQQVTDLHQEITGDTQTMQRLMGEVIATLDENRIGYDAG